MNTNRYNSSRRVPHCHSKLDVRQCIQNSFIEEVMYRNSEICWSPRFPDLSQLDFSLSFTLNERYSFKIIDHLERVIRITEHWENEFKEELKFLIIFNNKVFVFIILIYKIIRIFVNYSNGLLICYITAIKQLKKGYQKFNKYDIPLLLSCRTFNKHFLLSEKKRTLCFIMK